MQPFTVEQQYDGQTLAAFMRASLPALSWSEARRHIQSRRVRVNDVVCIDDSRRLRTSDRVDLLTQSTKPLPSASDIKIVHEDEHLIVIDKPAGMEAERRFEQRDWSQEKRSRQPAVAESLIAKGFKVLPVHRLDRETSGLMIYPLTGAARERLVAQFAAHAVERTYLAIALGVVPSVTIRNWIIRDRGDGLRGCIDHEAANAQEAISHLRALENIGDRYTLLECRLETGRTHQIRLHLAAIGHPVCGEKLYRKPSAGAPDVPDTSTAPRHALHSATLALQHPISEKRLSLQSPPPPDFVALLERLRKAT